MSKNKLLNKIIPINFEKRSIQSNKILKEYKFLSDFQNELLNEDMTIYLTSKEKEAIIYRHDLGMNVPNIEKELNIPCYVILQYLVTVFGTKILTNKFRYIGFNLGKEKKGDLYVFFRHGKRRISRAKWVYSRILTVDLSLIDNDFIIHHINYFNSETIEDRQDNKLTDTIDNLCLILDQKMHTQLHLKRVRDEAELENFIRKYIDEEKKVIVASLKKDHSIEGRRELNKQKKKLELYDYLINKQFNIQRIRKEKSS